VIGVEVRNGIVTLSGAPQSYRRILAVIEIAASFPACHGVVNRLRVRSIRPMSDAEIADLVRAILGASRNIRKETITVAVRDGEVTLRGTVSTIEQGLIAEDIAMGIGGVRSVRNLLLCDLIAQVEDARVSHDFEVALKSTPGLRGEELRVAFSGDTLVLTGTVSEPWQRELAESVVERFRPIRVQNAISTG
jgi:osmotically-inducible protein OsmY